MSKLEYVHYVICVEKKQERLGLKKGNIFVNGVYHTSSLPLPNKTTWTNHMLNFINTPDLSSA